MDNTNLTHGSELSPVVQEIKSVLDVARNNVAQQVNNELLNTYWNIGRIICEYEQSVPDRADYGKQTLKELSKELTQEFGKEFSRSNLQNMRLFYQTYQKCQTLSGKLSWSHYCELLSIADPDKRSFYEKETINSAYSTHFVSSMQTHTHIRFCIFHPFTLNGNILLCIFLIIKII